MALSSRSSPCASLRAGPRRTSEPCTQRPGPRSRRGAPVRTCAHSRFDCFANTVTTTRSALSRRSMPCARLRAGLRRTLEPCAQRPDHRSRRWSSVCACMLKCFNCFANALTRPGVALSLRLSPCTRLRTGPRRTSEPCTQRPGPRSRRGAPVCACMHNRFD